MKTFFTNNTRLKEVKGWKTTDKRGHVNIQDYNNGLFFEIEFGKNPKLFVGKMEPNGDISDVVFEQRIKV